jgi:hypothetical protein
MKQDRRRSIRVPATRPVKLFHQASGRFLPASTVNVSAGGVMLQITWPCALRPGEPVDVYLPTDARAVLTGAHRIPARVLRVLATEALCLVAIGFSEPLPEALPVAA